MAKQTGKETYVQFGAADVSVVLRDFNVSNMQNSADSTAGADEYENTVPTTKSFKATAQFVMLKNADGGAAILAAMRAGTEANLLWGFEGNAVGKPKGGAFCRVAKFDRKGNYKNVVLADVEWDNVGESLLFDDSTDTW